MNGRGIVDREVKEFFKDLIQRTVSYDVEGAYMSEEAIKNNIEDIARIWFKRNNFSLEFLLEEAQNNLFGCRLYAFMNGQGDISELREDVVECLPHLIYEYYRHDISEYIQETIDEMYSDNMVANGFIQVMEYDTGVMNWQ